MAYKLSSSLYEDGNKMSKGQVIFWSIFQAKLYTKFNIAKVEKKS